MRDLATASSAPPDNLPNLDGLGRAYELVDAGVLDSEGLERANEQIEADPQLLAAVEHAADLLASNAPLLTRADARKAIVAWVYVCWIALTVVATVTGAPVLGVALAGLGAAGFGAPHLAKGALHLFDKALPPSSSKAEVDQNEEDDEG